MINNISSLAIFCLFFFYCSNYLYVSTYLCELLLSLRDISIYFERIEVEKKKHFIVVHETESKILTVTYHIDNLLS